MWKETELHFIYFLGFVFQNVGKGKTYCLSWVSRHEYAQYSYSYYSESRTSWHPGLPSRCVRNNAPECDLTFAISIAIIAFRILLIFVATNVNASLAMTFESGWTISVHISQLLFPWLLVLVTVLYKAFIYDSLILYLLALYLLPFVYAIYAFTFSW